MKLYTEEQIREAMFELTLYPYDNGVDKILENLTPIELPSDEKIEKVAEKTLSVNLIGFITGAKWMRDQILGKEDKTFKKKSQWTEVDNKTRRLK